MKILFFLLVAFFISSVFAGTNFSAKLINNDSQLLIELNDDHLLPPFEAGELWKIIKGNDMTKMVLEKELTINCHAFTNQTNETVGNCRMVIPYNQFQRINEKMVMKASGGVAARLNSHFIDSAYLSMQRNQVYLSSYNTRRLFFFGINESLIQK